MREYQFFKNIKIQRQLFSTLLLIFSLPVLIIGFILVYNSNQNMTQRYTEQISSENTRVKSILFDLTTNLYNISEGFILDSTLEDLLTREYSSNDEVRQYFDSYKSITTTLSQQTSIHRINIYTHNATIKNYNHFLYATPEVQAADWYTALSTSKNIVWKTTPRTEHGYTYYDLTLFRCIPLPLAKDFAILEITVSDNYLRNRMDNPVFPSMASVNGESVFYHTGMLSGTHPMSVPIDYTLPYYQYCGRLTSNDVPCLGSITTLKPYRSDDCIYIFSYSNDALPYIHRLTVTYLFIVLLALFIPCALLYFYTRYFSARVSLLRTAMHQVSHDDFNIINSFKGNDELSEAFCDLQVMVDKIRQQESLVYETKIREQELENRQQQMEFKMLASQINPHFLYNTLESIRMKSFNENNLEVANALKLLGRYLRYALESTGNLSTTLEKELYYMELYINIQKLRFKERVNYTIVLEDGLNPGKYEILPFLLQPVIENAILHGLEGLEQKGQLSIDIFTENNRYLYITIKDNGEGMDTAELEALRSSVYIKDNNKTHNIGLYNINQRITLCYGSDYGIQIDSQKGAGTCVSLRLPCKKID